MVEQCVYIVTLSNQGEVRTGQTHLIDDGRLSSWLGPSLSDACIGEGDRTKGVSVICGPITPGLDGPACATDTLGSCRVRGEMATGVTGEATVPVMDLFFLNDSFDRELCPEPTTGDAFADFMAFGFIRVLASASLCFVARLLPA